MLHQLVANFDYEIFSLLLGSVQPFVAVCFYPLMLDKELFGSTKR